jgi:hypothetical protein
MQFNNRRGAQNMALVQYGTDPVTLAPVETGMPTRF